MTGLFGWMTWSDGLAVVLVTAAILWVLLQAMEDDE